VRALTRVQRCLDRYSVTRSIYEPESVFTLIRSPSVTNSGTAPVTNVKLSATPPSGWKVTFDPESIASLDANTTQTVTAHLVPSGDAVAGDYPVTLKADGDQSTTSSVDIRFTVETSLMWAFVGIALIVIVVVGLGWVYQRYGRR